MEEYGFPKKSKSRHYRRKSEDPKIEAIVKIEVKTLLLSLLKKDIYFLLS